MKFVAVDTETGGLDPARHPIIQIAALAVSNWEVVETFERKLSFDLETAEADALRANSFDLEVWEREAVEPRDAAFQFAAFLNRHKSVEMVSKKTGRPYSVAQLVGHNVEFDVRFLTALFVRLEMFRPWSPQTLCTRQLAAWAAFERGTLGDLYALYRPEAITKSLKLEALCEHHGIALDAHDALRDVRATVELARALSGRGDLRRVTSLAEVG